MIVKICGLSTFETLDVALDAGADMVGFVFFDRSPRHLMLEAAAPLFARAKGQAARVALVVDADDDFLDTMVAELSPDLLQLHGKETPERVAGIRARFGLPVMKAVGIAVRADLAKIPAYAAVCDRLLLDAKPPPDAMLPGGNGVPFDWTLLDGFAPGVPWMLSGGLTPDNVAEAIRLTAASAVDVSSGVESAPGVKDMARIRAFIAAAHGARP